MDTHAREAAVAAAESDSGMRTVPRPLCPLCGAPGRPLYASLRDRLYGVPGEWNLLRCADRRCRLLWLDPAPAPEDLHKAYRRYHTHEAAPEPEPDEDTPVREAYWATRYGYRPTGRPEGAWRLRLRPYRRLQADMAVRFLPACPGGRLLDVGCGNGAWLAFMNARGWRAQGVEPDETAAAAARARGLEVRSGTLEDQAYPGDYFDAVTLYHVIEHVPNPARLLRECRRVLKPAGRLVVATPNGDSLGRRLFGADWRGLEPPRHLQVFNRDALARLIDDAGLSVEQARTLTATRYTLQESWARRRGVEPPAAAGPARALTALSVLAGALHGRIGEAVVAVARNDGHAALRNLLRAGEGGR